MFNSEKGRLTDINTDIHITRKIDIQITRKIDKQITRKKKDRNNRLLNIFAHRWRDLKQQFTEG